MAEVMMQMNGSEILTLRNKVQKSSILFAKKIQVVLVPYLNQEMICKGGRQPLMCNFVWFLMP